MFSPPDSCLSLTPSNLSFPTSTLPQAPSLSSLSSLPLLSTMPVPADGPTQAQPPPLAPINLTEPNGAPLQPIHQQTTTTVHQKSPHNNLQQQPYHHLHHHHQRHAPPPPPQPTPPPSVHTRAPRFPGYEDYRFFIVTHPAQYVAHVEIHRPEKLNAFSEPVWLEFGSLFRRITRDSSIRAVVLSGAGRAFTSGMDVKEATNGVLGSSLSTDGQDVVRTAAALRRYIGEFQNCISAMDSVGKPVVAAIHGLCIGLGVDIACCADVRFASVDARFAVKEVDIGMAADIGSLARLPKIVGNQSWVREVCYTARAWGATEAERMGFVSKVCMSKDETLAQAIGLASIVAEKSPVAVQGTKEILLHARDHSVEDSKFDDDGPVVGWDEEETEVGEEAGRMVAAAAAAGGGYGSLRNNRRMLTDGADLRFTAVWNGVALQSADFKSALLSGFSKRKPKFEKL